MKYSLSLSILSLVLLSTSCGNKSKHNAHNHDHGDAAATGNTTDALYDEVMKVHDEVMPKMEDIYKLQQELKKQIADSPTMVDEKRQEIETKIANLEEASKSMMVWMREFNPPADSLGEETMREYLESEMEKVKKVKEIVNEVLKPENQ
jgi:HEPN domain-containing protein